MSEGDGPEHEDPVIGTIGLAAALQVRLLEGDDLALFGHLLHDDDDPHVGLEKTGFPEVGDPAQLEEIQDFFFGPWWWSSGQRSGFLNDNPSSILAGF